MRVTSLMRPRITGRKKASKEQRGRAFGKARPACYTPHSRCCVESRAGYLLRPTVGPGRRSDRPNAVPSVGWSGAWHWHSSDSFSQIRNVAEGERRSEQKRRRDSQRVALTTNHPLSDLGQQPSQLV